MSAAALLAEAAAAGARPRLAEDGRLRAPGDAPPELLVRLREHKAALVEILAGRACRRCGAPVGPHQDSVLPFADGTVAHLACEDAWDLERIHRRAENALSPEALADPAELMIRGGPLP